MGENLYYTPATGIARKIRSQEVSPTRVINQFLDRINDLNGDINAFTYICEQEAREAAREAERAIKDGNDIGPLHGVPVAIKDLSNVDGVETSFGSNLFPEFTPERDDLEVKRLKEAGAIVIGKTNTPEFGRKPMTTNYRFGVTSNPWDTDKTTGGSSGGSAAALAAGMVPIAQGTDAAGSIRIPASACGVFGLMPDFGRIPLSSRPDAFQDTQPFTYTGPLTRSVEDAALMMDIMAGHHPKDPFSLPDRNDSYIAETRRSIKDFNIAYSQDLGICTVSSKVTDVTDDAVEYFSVAGASIDETDPSFEHDWDTLHDALEVILQIRFDGMNENFKKDYEVNLLDHPDEVTEEVISRIEKAQGLTGKDHRKAERIRTDAYDSVQNLFNQYDLLVTPTLGIPPFEKDTKPSTINGEQIDPLHGWILTWPFNLTGNPAASIPAGTTEEGLPVGLQIVGPRLGDKDIITGSAVFERFSEWQEMYPLQI